MQASDPLAQDTSVEQSSLDMSAEWIKVFVLLGLCIYFAYNIASGDITNYVNDRFSWLSYLAVILFAMLGLSSAYALYRRDTSSGYASDAHNMGGLSWWTILIVALPLVMGTMIPSRPLGADAINGEVSLTVASVNSAAAFSRDPLERNVLDWLRVFSQENAPSRFDGQEASVIGFVYREPNFPADTFMVARFTVSCCVADAQPIGLPVYAPDMNDQLVDGEWVSVAGLFEANLFRDTTVPVLQATNVEVVEQPEHPYLYP